MTAQVLPLPEVPAVASPAAAPLLEAHGLCWSVPVRGAAAAPLFRRRAPPELLPILRDATLSLRRGESVGVAGPSGSGKTSLLMLLAGLERPTAGRVVIDGTELGSLGEDALARFRGSRIGIVFQSFHLIPTMTAIENVAVPLELSGIADAFPRAEAALRQVGLGHRLHHLPGQLSGGEQQRTAIARAFAPGPALLLADEPTGNLDARTGEGVAELLFALQRDRGTALLLITHDARLARRCDRVLSVSEGRLGEA